MKNQSEEVGALQSAKKQPSRRTGQKRPKKQPEKRSSQGRMVPLKKNITIMKENLAKKIFIAKEKAIKGRICRERSNNAMLKRTEKRKQ